MMGRDGIEIADGLASNSKAVLLLLLKKNFSEVDHITNRRLRIA